MLVVHHRKPTFISGAYTTCLDYTYRLLPLYSQAKERSIVSFCVFSNKTKLGVSLEALIVSKAGCFLLRAAETNHAHVEAIDQRESGPMQRWLTAHAAAEYEFCPGLRQTFSCRLRSFRLTKDLSRIRKNRTDSSIIRIFCFFYRLWSMGRTFFWA